MKIILCAYNWTGCEALRILKEQGHEVFVFTHEAPWNIPSVSKLCENWGIPYSFDNVSKTTLPFKPDVICSIFYRYIISKKVIQSCEGKIFNLHPSLLPLYKGCSSLTWAMIEGEKETGFTYHYINEKCDEGDILLQNKITINDWDTQETLYTRAMFESMKPFLGVLNRVIAGESGTIQSGESSYFARGCPHNGDIDDVWPLEKVERFIRAMTYPPYEPAKYKGQIVKTLEEYLALKS